MSKIIAHVSSPYTIPGPTLHRALLLPLHHVLPGAWTVTSIVIVVVIVVATSITVERMLGLILTSYIVVNAMMNTSEALLVIRCKEKRRRK